MKKGIRPRNKGAAQMYCTPILVVPSSPFSPCDSSSVPPSGTPFLTSQNRRFFKISPIWRSVSKHLSFFEPSNNQSLKLPQFDIAIIVFHSSVANSKSALQYFWVLSKLLSCLTFFCCLQFPCLLLFETALKHSTVSFGFVLNT